MNTARYQPISDYGIIGDLSTVGLVGLDGSIDFMCLPRFDSPSIFAALLDRDRGGFFKIAPIMGAALRKQIYLPDSNVLLTRFLSSEGVSEITDFMPIYDQKRGNIIIRHVSSMRETGIIAIAGSEIPLSAYALSSNSATRRKQELHAMGYEKLRRHRQRRASQTHVFPCWPPDFARAAS